MRTSPQRMLGLSSAAWVAASVAACHAEPAFVWGEDASDADGTDATATDATTDATTDAATTGTDAATTGTDAATTVADTASTDADTTDAVDCAAPCDFLGCGPVSGCDAFCPCPSGSACEGVCACVSGCIESAPRVDTLRAALAYGTRGEPLIARLGDAGGQGWEVWVDRFDGLHWDDSGVALWSFDGRIDLAVAADGSVHLVATAADGEVVYASAPAVGAAFTPGPAPAHDCGEPSLRTVDGDLFLGCHGSASFIVLRLDRDAWVAYGPELDTNGTIDDVFLPLAWKVARGAAAGRPVVHAAFVPVGQQSKVMYARLDEPTGTWSTSAAATGVAPPTKEDQTLAIALDDSGRALVAFTDARTEAPAENRVRTAWNVVGNTWVVDTVRTVLSPASVGSWLALEQTPGVGTFVVYRVGDALESRVHQADGGWRGAELLPLPEGDDSGAVDLAADPSGRVHIVYVNLEGERTLWTPAPGSAP